MATPSEEMPTLGDLREVYISTYVEAAVAGLDTGQYEAAFDAGIGEVFRHWRGD